jgi:hypothetical protein
MQAINKSTNRIIEYKGKKQPLAVWCKDLGLCYNTINTRLRRGLTFEEAIMEEPPKVCGDVVYKGEILSLSAFCKQLRLNFETVCSLYVQGYSGDDIAASPMAKKINKPKLYSYMGKSMTLPRWAKKFGLNISTVRDKLKKFSFTFLCDMYLNKKS